MKRILVLIIILLSAIVTMAYLYFSGLNAEKKDSDGALYASTVNSAVIFAFQNDKTILETLSSQPLLFEILGKEKVDQLKLLTKFLLRNPAINHFADKQNIYISILPVKEKNIDFLFSTQLNAGTDVSQLSATLKGAGIQATADEELTKLILTDGSIFYLRLKNNILQLSSNRQVIKNSGLNVADDTGKFVEYILSTSKLNKSSLAEVYINYQSLPDLLKAFMPGNLSGEMSTLGHPNAYTTLVYNYSTDHILLSGSTKINDLRNYYQLYAGSPSVKTTINNILPQNTANYTIYTIDNYNSWHKSLNSWFSKNDLQKIAITFNSIRDEFHLNPENAMPKYFKNQLIAFRLSSGEKLGAINLSNGEKLEQLLLDLSSNYTDDIKALKVTDLLFAYFGEPFRKFKKPYYVIIDNYMVFANNPNSLQTFLNSYKNNRLLLGDADYANSINELSNISGITVYVDLNNSSGIIQRNLYLPYYRHIIAPTGLGNYSSFIFQLTGEQNKWQTNILLSKKKGTLLTDSSNVEIDSLQALH